MFLNAISSYLIALNFAQHAVSLVEYLCRVSMAYMVKLGQFLQG